MANKHFFKERSSLNPADLLRKYFPPHQEAFSILERHSLLVARKAADIARALPVGVDTDFVYQAAMLHDIGICRTDTPGLGCFGTLPYICHGHAGREILEAEGLERHALVCERHIGVGLSASEIRRQKLPLPHRDMIPESVEEQIIAYADLFFSKAPGRTMGEKSPEEIRTSLGRFGEEKVAIFEQWHALFGRHQSNR